MKLRAASATLKEVAGEVRMDNVSELSIQQQEAQAMLQRIFRVAALLSTASNGRPDEKSSSPHQTQDPIGQQLQYPLNRTNNRKT